MIDQKVHIFLSFSFLEIKGSDILVGEVDFKIKKIQNVEWNVRREMMEEMKTKRNSNHNGCEQQI